MRQQGDYSDLIDWVERHYDMRDYFNVDDLLWDIEQRFRKDNHPFPDKARDKIITRWEYAAEFAEIEQRRKEQQQIADMLGSGTVPQSLSDEILEDIRKPEIMDIDFSDFIKTREERIPKEIREFYETNRQTFFGRIASGFKRIFRRRE